jgi:hypothetical protein
MAILDTELGYLGRFRARHQRRHAHPRLVLGLHDNPPASPRRPSPRRRHHHRRARSRSRTRSSARWACRTASCRRSSTSSPSCTATTASTLPHQRRRRGSGNDEAVRRGDRRHQAVPGAQFVLRGRRGWKVANGYGSATPRAFVGFIFEPSIGDRDGDGYKDDVDQCPDDPEDFDDFEDEDGCPEPDNDKDGILDDPDKCPNEPETKNGYQDDDGCPDATTFDRDGDRIPDDVDKCPDDPEDFDNFEDEDGCPDPDNDKDGIKDVEDACPERPEDKDGFEDTDGCPDPDNDHDRILDVSDKCPNEPETYNGVDDEDGCPDQGLATMTKGKIVTMKPIYFETDKDIIKPESFPVVGFGGRGDQRQPVDRSGRDPGARRRARRRRHNLDPDERRAASVRRALEERNVLPSKLKSHGYGETKPICKEHNEGCWSKNRRVEFIIEKTSGQGGAKFQGGEGQ